jgi:putative addiction module component (TIGR02574 family)
MSIADIKKMPIIERVHLMEQIWDTLNHETLEIDSPAWHSELLQERKKAIKEGNVKMYTLNLNQNEDEYIRCYSF